MNGHRIILFTCCLLCAFAFAASPSTSPTTRSSGNLGFVSQAKYNALKRDRDAVVEQLRKAMDENARLEQENRELRDQLSQRSGK